VSKNAEKQRCQSCWHVSTNNAKAKQTSILKSNAFPWFHKALVSKTKCHSHLCLGACHHQPLGQELQPNFENQENDFSRNRNDTMHSVGPSKAFMQVPHKRFDSLAILHRVNLIAHISFALFSN